VIEGASARDYALSSTMPVRIRLARPPGATKLTSHYHIVAVDSRKRRDAKPIEILGIYDPKLRSRFDKSRGWTVEDALQTISGTNAPPTPECRVEWSVDRLRYWVGVGAEPTKTIVNLLDYVSSTPSSSGSERSFQYRVSTY
jgi:small subunit ribosomal protein S16